MPTSIPYSPSLVLGSVVQPAAMATLLEMAALQGPVDAAQDTLNSFISLKRGLEMTASELVNMNIDPNTPKATPARRCPSWNTPAAWREARWCPTSSCSDSPGWHSSTGATPRPHS
jgi:hypothetical protein